MTTQNVHTTSSAFIMADIFTPGMVPSTSAPFYYWPLSSSTRAYKCHCSKAPSHQLLRSICLLFYPLSPHRFPPNRFDKINQSTFWSQAHFCNLQDTATHYTNSIYSWISGHICATVTSQHTQHLKIWLVWSLSLC